MRKCVVEDTRLQMPEEHVLVVGAWLEEHRRPRVGSVAPYINVPARPTFGKACHCELSKEKILKGFSCLFVKLRFGAKRQ